MGTRSGSTYSSFESTMRRLRIRLGRLPGTVMSTDPDGRVTVTVNGVVIARLTPRLLAAQRRVRGAA